MPGCGKLVFDKARLDILHEMCTLAIKQEGQCVQLLQEGSIVEGDTEDDQIERHSCSPCWHEDPETLFELKCKSGHAFAGSIKVLRQGGWCPICDTESSKQAHMSLLHAHAGEDMPTLRRAIEAADAMQVDADAVRRARTRLTDLVLEADQQARCTKLGAPPSAVSLPNEFFCPITQQRMVNPVVASDGFTYERIAIEEVMRTTGISPLTREQLYPIVFPNLALKGRIRSYHGDVQRIAELVYECARKDERERLITLAKLVRSRRIRMQMAALPNVELPLADKPESPEAEMLPANIPSRDELAGLRVTRTRAAAAGKRVRAAGTNPESHEMKCTRCSSWEKPSPSVTTAAP